MINRYLLVINELRYIWYMLGLCSLYVSTGLHVNYGAAESEEIHILLKIKLE